MAEYTVISSNMMDCDVCGEEHLVELRREKSEYTIKDVSIICDRFYFYCVNEDVEFETGKMIKENLLRAKDEYRRQNNLLTSREIIDIRNIYGLTQVELAKLLGWGEVTITRYETKAIQEVIYDDVLKSLRNPFEATKYLEKNKNNFSEDRYHQLFSKMTKINKLSSDETETRESLRREYIDFRNPCVENGFKTLQISMLETVISYIAEAVLYPYKVKMMKMLWYSDMLSYQRRGKSITGLIYQHYPMGALPIGHRIILTLDNINIEEIIECDYVKYKFNSSDNVDISNISEEDKEILDTIIAKFKDYNAKEIVEYMHKEKAYMGTSEGEIISYEYAKELNIV